MAKGGLAKQRFRDRQRHNRIVAQLETLKAGGVTEEQVRAAGTSAWREYGGQALANLEAQKAGQTPTAITPTTPGAVTTGYTQGGGLAQTLSQGPAIDTAAPPTQWWQRTNQNSQTKGSFQRAITGMQNSLNPFGGVTGSTGTGDNKTPTVPAWLGGMTSVGLGTQGVNALKGASAVAQGTKDIEWWRRYTSPAGAPTGRDMRDPGTVTGRNVDPSTGIPDFPMLAGLGEGPGGGGYGYNWKKRRKGGGGGGRWYQPRPDYAYDNKGREPFVPSSGLASWSIG
jgi:hypothetical protein